MVLQTFIQIPLFLYVIATSVSVLLSQVVQSYVGAQRPSEEGSMQIDSSLEGAIKNTRLVCRIVCPRCQFDAMLICSCTVYDILHQPLCVFSISPSHTCHSSAAGITGSAARFAFLNRSLTRTTPRRPSMKTPDGSQWLQTSAWISWKWLLTFTRCLITDAGRRVLGVFSSEMLMWRDAQRTDTMWKTSPDRSVGGRKRQ